MKRRAALFLAAALSCAHAPEFVETAVQGSNPYIRITPHRDSFDVLVKDNQLLNVYVSVDELRLASEQFYPDDIMNEFSHSYRLPVLPIGLHTITVEAFDWLDYKTELNLEFRVSNPRAIEIDKDFFKYRPVNSVEDAIKRMQ